MAPASQLVPAIVAIGRNEGLRLQLCLRAALATGALVVYVDSGSSDDSVAFASSLGCTVVELDGSEPFTAARGRNAGFQRLMELAPATEFVQFLDGDCEIDPSWFQAALAELEAHPEAAQVRGHVAEMFPTRSPYNLLTHLEWQQNLGEVYSCGGRFLIRASVWRALGGMHHHIIAAEDEEFCVRVRQAGFTIRMMDAAMARHDVDLSRFGQWFRRARRAGHGYAQVNALHGHTADRTFASDVRKIWIWGFVLPLLGLLFAWPSRGLSLLLVLALYFAQYMRIRIGLCNRQWTPHEKHIYALLGVLSRIPGVLGLLEFKLHSLQGRSRKIIEYK